MDWITEKGYDPVYGARPIKRALQRELETPVAKEILSGKYNNKKLIYVDVQAGKLHLS